MNKKFTTLKKQLSPQAKRKAERKLQETLETMALQEIRQTKGTTQEELARTLLQKQANISRLERRDDMHISTLRDYIEALGGTLRIIAHFPEGDICINQFD